MVTIDCIASALIGYRKSLSLRQRLCRGFSMLECFSHVLLCASYVLTLLLTQELRLGDPWLVLYRSLPCKATRPSYITIASHLSPASPATYLNGQHRPPYRPRLPCVFSCLASLLFSSCRVPPCRCYCCCRPAVHSMTPKTTDHLILISALCDSADRN